MQRFLKPIFSLGLLALIVTQYVPEKEEGKRADPATKIVPLHWIDESQLLIRIGNDHFIRNADGRLEPSSFSPRPSSPFNDFSFQLTPTATDQISTEEVHQNGTHIRDDTFLSIDGKKILVERPDLRRQSGANQGFPRGDYLDFVTFRHDGEIGLIVFTPTGPRQIALPLQDPQNQSAPAIVQDRVSGNLFAFQSDCGPGEGTGTCTRTAWWLDRNLQITSSFLLPTDDPFYTEEKPFCFSCGCGCYIQEDVYALNGTAYFQYSGFPLPLAQRGLYQAVPQSGGTAIWGHLIKGQIEPPIAFSPSGCQVAYFHLSAHGDSLETMNLCQSPKGQP